MKPSVYIETSIPSFYYEVRTEPDNVARRNWTRQWWNLHRGGNDPAGDALHLAIASFHKCDFVLTWNCRHLANANKFGHIRRINNLLGIYVPSLVTPLELLGES